MISVSQLETRVRRLEQQLGSRHPQVAYLPCQSFFALSTHIAFCLVPFPLVGLPLGALVSLWVVWYPFEWFALKCHLRAHRQPCTFSCFALSCALVCDVIAKLRPPMFLSVWSPSQATFEQIFLTSWSGIPSLLQCTAMAAFSSCVARTGRGKALRYGEGW